MPKHEITFNESGDIITIDGTVIYNPDNFHDVKKNQFTKRNLDGDNVVYSTGNTVCNGILIIKNVTYADGQILRAWIVGSTIFMKNTFTLSEASGLINLGNGKGVAITGARYTKKDIKGVIVYEPPGIYTVKFPYRFIRT